MFEVGSILAIGVCELDLAEVCHKLTVSSAF